MHSIKVSSSFSDHNFIFEVNNMNGRLRITRILFFLLFSVVAFGSISAQTYKRNVVFEEFTGTWCGWCPYGGYNLDSIEHRMGHNAVVISWHNGDEMHITAQDTAGTACQVSGYPNTSMDRQKAVAEAALWTEQNQWYVAGKKDAVKDPLVDFRLVNATYDPGTHMMNYDIDITPFDLTMMGREDTCTYVTVAVVTEDGIVSSQHIYDPQTGGALPNVDDYVHRNVVRKVGGKASGDLMNLGTKTPVLTYPIRRHYRFAIDPTNWKATMMKAKAFIAMKSNKAAIGQFVLNADQTDIDFTLLPSTAANAVWVVLPRHDDNLDPTVPQNIIWAAGGTTNSVKLEYTVDNGANWSVITASTGASPYAWTIPSNAYGKTAMIRITDTKSGTVTSLSDAFLIQTAIPASLAVAKPSTGEKIEVGSTYVINFSFLGGVTSNKTLDYSLDNGSTWSQITKVAGSVTTANWTVPTTTSTSAIVRIKDDNGIVGMSGVFSIIAKVAAKINSLSIYGQPNVPSNTTANVMWTTTGTLTEMMTLSWSPDSTNWTTISNSIPTSSTSYNWMTPNQYAPKAWIKLESGAISATSSQFVIGVAQAVSLPGAVPNTFSLGQNYPNPFNPSTTITYAIPQRAIVTLSVRDVLGKEVKHLPSEMLAAGRYSVTVDMSDLPSGTYMYTLHANDQMLEGKMLLKK
jgi:hypothetical protein